MGTPVIWCRHCRVGFALVKPYPATCLNEGCQQPAEWAAESPTPRRRYNLTDGDTRFLRSLRITSE